MTHQFTKDDWKQSGQAFKIELQFDSSTQLPIVQVYKQELEIAIQQICTIIVSASIITVVSLTAFDGSVVIK